MFARAIGSSKRHARALERSCNDAMYGAVHGT